MTHTKSTARSQSSRRFGHLFKSHLFATGRLCSFAAGSPPCSRFGQFSPNRISRRSLYWSLFGVYGVQKGARLAPVGATPLGRAGGREHDILGRQNVSEAAGAAAEHEGRPVESERGRVVARMVRLTDSEKNTRCARGRNAPGARRDGAVRARRIPRDDPRAANSARFRGTVRTKSLLARAPRRAVAPSSRAPFRFSRAPAWRPTCPTASA